MNIAHTPSAAIQRPERSRRAWILALDRAIPDIRIEIFAPDWPAVDLVRSLISSLGLEHRIGVHHAQVLLCPLFRAALSQNTADIVLIPAS